MKSLKFIIVAFGLLVQTNASAQSKEKLESYDQYLSELAQRDLFSGSVLIAKEGEVCFQKAYGLASRDWQVQNQLDTKFNLASMGKIFTAISIGKLVERKTLDLDEVVGVYLPDIENRDLKNKVTIRHLLSHRSGVGDIFSNDYFTTDKSRFRSVNDWDSQYITSDLAFEPGTQFRYSNGGFMLLGKIIEKVSGMSYEDFVSKEIFQVCEMENSGYYEIDKVNYNLADSYTYSTGQGFSSSKELRKNIFMHSVKGGPAGGGYSTALDLLKFHNALYNGKLISSETREELLARSTKNDEEGYALGFQLTERFGRSVQGHTGGFQGVSTIYEYYKDDDIALIVLGNLDMAGMIAAERFARIIDNQSLLQPNFSVPVGSEYEITVQPDGGPDQGVNLPISVMQGFLMVDGMMRYVPLNEHQFFDIIFEDIKLNVLRDPDTNELRGFVQESPFGMYNLRKLGEEEIRQYQVQPISQEALEVYKGRYEIVESTEGEEGHMQELALRKNGLYIEGRVPLLHYEKDKFYDENHASFQVYFDRDKEGNVKGYKVFFGARHIATAIKR